ncbi:MAG TPA: phenylalanine--tRNA ligase subunit beta [Steroidobacteraceae bacterium]|jgi:phenylalanyl-tRNA synthetase beta chain|nr:phenylalanine--tRNA ligase subunit beta [Steroidobacteraceae bacterium]
MKIPYSWLAEWVGVPWSAQELGSRLTMAGLELEALEPAAPPFSGVVVAEILSAEKHPQADKLRVCRVATGEGEPLQIVCGAANARAGLKSALAIVGAKLPGGLEIKTAKLRGTESAGMLCAAKELGLADTSSGIVELPSDAPVGKPLREYLALDDAVLELNITPNRGDAMSIIGVAREVAALAGGKLTGPAGRTGQAPRPTAASGDTVAIHLDAPGGCPKFVGRVIRGVSNTAATPMWMRERLRRAGVRSISPVVDVTNYVMLELGQPMHGYDLAKLNGEIHARFGRAGEPITLLDGKTVEVQPDVLLIADAAGPVGIAGVMGGQRTAVSAETTDIFFEAAYFAPDAIVGRALRWGLTTDASQRFERGVDPSQQARAIERATELLLEIAGGQAGPVSTRQSEDHLPVRPAVPLRRKQLARLLGLGFADERVRASLEGLQMAVESTAEGWRVTPPAHRFDIAIEADLIEEVARIVGYQAIPEADAPVPQRFGSLPSAQPPEPALLETLALRGYHEAITYAFVDPQLQTRLFPDLTGIALANPIASDLSVMRVSLWPGLLKAALENQRRQQDRVRLFEHGARFLTTAGTPGAGGGATREVDTLAGIACGQRLPEQWGLPRDMREPVDFFDVKADVAALLAATGAAAEFSFEPGALSCLHPGRAALIKRKGEPVGWLGELHPSLVKALEFTYSPVLFELDAQPALAVERPAYREVSRFPQVRRDLAVVLDESVALSSLTERVTFRASSLLRDLRVFDVYRGPEVEAGRKSVALGLIFQDISRTLTEDDVATIMAAVVADLRVSLNAKIRE